MTDFHPTETRLEAIARCNRYADMVSERSHVYDGRWNGGQFYVMIRDSQLAPEDLSRIVYSTPG